MRVVKTDEQWDIKEGDTVIASSDSYPPTDETVIEAILEEANISTDQKEMFKILFGVAPVNE